MYHGKHSFLQIIIITTVITVIIYYITKKQKQFWLVNFTKKFKEMASNTEWNVKFWSRKTKMVFSCNTLIIFVLFTTSENNLLQFIINIL